MKEFIFTVENLVEGNRDYYKIKASDIEDAKEVFMKSFIPLIYESYDWYEFTRLLESADIQIDFMDLENVVEL